MFTPSWPAAEILNNFLWVFIGLMEIHHTRNGNMSLIIDTFKNLKHSLGPFLQLLYFRVSLKLNEKNLSYHFTRF